jgi:hypothetical protein
LLCKFAEKRRKGSTNETVEGSPELFPPPPPPGEFGKFIISRAVGEISRGQILIPCMSERKRKKEGFFATLKTLQKIFV